ncbi:hypothetical protein MKX01_012217, partial [Papaver californicum]
EKSVLGQQRKARKRRQKKKSPETTMSADQCQTRPGVFSESHQGSQTEVSGAFCFRSLQ